MNKATVAIGCFWRLDCLLWVSFKPYRLILGSKQALEWTRTDFLIHYSPGIADGSEWPFLSLIRLAPVLITKWSHNRCYDINIWLAELSWAELSWAPIVVKGCIGVGVVWRLLRTPHKNLTAILNPKYVLKSNTMSKHTM
jgi:hypothetical protein